MAEMVLEVSHGDEAAAVARAHLAEWAARHVPDLADDLLLVVSELVTNAAVHGPAEPITLHLDASGPGRLSSTRATAPRPSPCAPPTRRAAGSASSSSTGSPPTGA
jgi:hypothetical protein